ncbi:MAG: tetratricopeptide repeat protein [Erythrobacter sp.]
MSIILSLALASAVAPGDAATQRAHNAAPDSGEELASTALARGQSEDAITRLKVELDRNPNDPALLINLGIAYAQIGADEDARVAFEAAMRSSAETDLQTADGALVDSRVLARKALSMLDRGAFR